jgi:hypothetical protein
MAEQFHKYDNKDCDYPFTPDPVGYCWTFAHHIDGTEGFEDLQSKCKGCEFVRPLTPTNKKGRE